MERSFDMSRIYPARHSRPYYRRSIAHKDSRFFDNIEIGQGRRKSRRAAVSRMGLRRKR